jgi:tol-pal system protein YbgF
MSMGSLTRTLDLRALAAVAALAGMGCGGAGPRATARTCPSTASGVVRRLSSVARAQAAEIRELEARLALASAEARDLRGALDAQLGSRRDAVRIGASAEAREPSSLHDLEWNENEDGPRPVLRLHGEPTAGLTPLPPEAFAVPGLPALSVAPLPPLPAGGVAGSATTASGGARSVEGAAPTEARGPEAAVAEEYRRALQLVREQRHAEAAQALSAFIAAHPRHAYADNALYWRAEVHYVQRRYEPAASDYRAIVERFPGGNKAPDALLKLALCHLRMGDRTQAQAYFAKLREQYPNSVAARIAAREDTT